MHDYDLKKKKVLLIGWILSHPGDMIEGVANEAFDDMGEIGVCAWVDLQQESNISTVYSSSYISAVHISLIYQTVNSHWPL